MAIRTNFLGQLPGDYAYSIAGQLSWVSLIYEIIQEAIILPLFFFLGNIDRETFANRLRSGLCFTAIIYTICSILVSAFAIPLLKLMAVSPELIRESATYIRIESIGFIFEILFSFMLVALVTLERSSTIYFLTFIKCFLSIGLDTVLVSKLPISLHLGVIGVGITNIVSNLLLFAVTIIVIHKCGVNVFTTKRIDYSWLRKLITMGGISGLESFVRNIAYMLMVSRLVNMVGEQGTYWVANNFIWGWLLLPVLQLGELIKRDTAANSSNIKKNTPAYFVITFIICALWLVTIPLYKPFMRYVLGYSDVDKLFGLVMTLLVFYICFAFQNIFDATFYGTGKTNYMLFESLMTNSIYYGSFFIAWKLGLFTPTLTGIALMFGFGNVFDSIVSGAVYVWFRKKYIEKN
jgi:Na+-driven multidrug efflux pump